MITPEKPLSLLRLVVAGALLSLPVACGTDQQIVDVNATGTLRVVVATTGVDVDPDGYTVTVDGVLSQTTSPSGSMIFDEVVVGVHSVELAGVANNCTVDQNPLNVTVVANETTEARFDVSCVALVGDLDVTVTTTGPDPDPDGYTVMVSGTESQAVTSNGTVSFARLTVGDRAVALTGLAANCTADQSSRTASITFAATTTVSFTVTCVAMQGTLDVQVTTTGPDPDPDGYTVTMAGSQSRPVASTGIATFEQVAVGDHTVELTGLAANCTTEQAAKTATVAFASTTTVPFTVTCVAAVGTLEVTVTTTGPDPDPDGYTVTVGGTESQAVAGTGTVTFFDLSAGTHEVELTGVAPNCTVDQSPRTGTVLFGGTTTIPFTVTCVASVGDVNVPVTTTGPDPDPDGYTITVDGTESQVVSSNGTLTFVGLADGMHTLALTGAAANCTADQTPKTVTVQFGGTTTVPFTVTCVPLVGDLDVALTTTGPDPDPDGYTITVDGGESLTVASSGTVTFAGLGEGVHTVALTGLAANCTVDQTPKTATISFATTTTVPFTVDCAALVGDLEVAVTTTGTDPDADGYTLTVDGTQSQSVANTGTVTFAGLAVGDHQVELSGIAPNCTVDQTPKTVTVSFSTTTTVTFDVTCVADVGDLDVTVTTTGPDQDPNGYTITVDGTQSQAVLTNGAVTFTGLAAGNHSVELVGIAQNCTVDQTPKTATVPFAGSTTVSFTVTCVDLVGDLGVTVTTTGPDPDPDGYTIAVDGTQSQAVTSNGTVTFTGLSVGDHTVELTGLASNCTVDQTPKTGTVSFATTGSVSFAVSCVALVGDLDVTVTTTGPNPDPDGYTITVDAAQSLPVSTGGTVTFTGLTVGDHSVELTGAAANCTVDQPTKTATIAFASTTTVTFTITCVDNVGDLDVTVTTSGPDPDPDGYSITVDGAQSQTVTTSGTVTFAGLPAGDHSVELTGLAANCTVDQTPKTATIVFATTTTVPFAVTCVPLVGDLDVAVTTTGPDPDPDGYTITVDGTQNQAVTSNGTVTFSSLSVGDHSVNLTGLAANCTVDQTPQTASIAFASTTTVTFTVTCVALVGDLDVTVTTTGSDPDPDGFTVSVDGTLSQSVASNGTVTFTSLAVGDHQVELTGLALNCTVDQSPKTATIAFATTTTLSFTVTCVPLEGDLDVTVSTTGANPDPDGYMVVVDGTETQSISNNGTVTFTALPAGDRSVALMGVANNCTVDQNPQTATVVAFQSVSISFAITCSAMTGDLDVTVSTTGTDLDPDGYTVIVDGTQSQAVTINGTTSFVGLAVGTRSVSLSGVAVNCTVDQNPQNITVLDAQTVTLNFAVSCVTAVGDLDVMVSTTGGDPDPDGYTVTVDGTSSQVVSSNGTVTFSGLPLGDHSVDLTGIASHCAVDQTPKTATVELASTATTTFTVTCLFLPQVLVGAGDIARCDLTFDEDTANLLDIIAGTVFTAGDNTYPSGTAQSYTDCYDPSWGRHKARTFPSAGNHDYDEPGAPGYFGYFGTAAGDPSEGYYSYDLGAWHIVVLNSNIARSANSPQIQWLEADLAASTKSCTLAYWHHPRFSSGGGGNAASMGAMWDALYAAGADVVVNGHHHLYERFAPQTPAAVSDPNMGIRQFTIGTGGTDLHNFGPIQPNSEVRDNNTHGVLKLTLNDGTYDWEFIPIAGQTFTDSGTKSCH